MNETQLRAFVTVTDAGGFAAAASLHMSQRGVSRAVRALEGELGADLFRRHRGRVELTAFGQRALTRARAVLTEFETAAGTCRRLLRRARPDTAGIDAQRVADRATRAAGPPRTAGLGWS